MAITTLDGIIAGAQPPQFFAKAVSGTLTTGRAWTPFYTAGIPGPAVAPTPGIAGAALTSYAGQLPFTNPGSGTSYLARLVAVSTNSVAGYVVLADRLWHNSGITITSNTAQTVNSVTFPARDINGSTNGDGVLLALEVSSQTGAGTPTITVSYTNSANTGSRTATNILATTANSIVGSTYLLGLEGGDVGVRSIQSITLSTSWTSGTVHLVAYRILSVLSVGSTGQAASVDSVTGGMPQMFNNTVPYLMFIPVSGTATGLQGIMTVTQG